MHKYVNSTNLYNNFQELPGTKLMPKLWDNGKKKHLHFMLNCAKVLKYFLGVLGQYTIHIFEYLLIYLFILILEQNTMYSVILHWDLADSLHSEEP